MAAKQFGAQIPERELAIVAWKLQMLDASKAELVKVCLYMLIPGMTETKAKERVLANRNPARLSDDHLILNVRVPEEDLEQVKQVLPELSDSQLLRYAVIRRTEKHEQALERAIVARGRKPKQSTAA